MRLAAGAQVISRELYDKLWGFDRHMRYWGVEDLDFGLKCWLMGRRILHDPEAVVGHRFRAAFDNYTVPMEHVVANQLRMARKHFTRAVWTDCVERCRQSHPHRLSEHPEGLWARAWQLFEQDRASAEQERTYLFGHRKCDEFWYAERFGLTWPRLQPLSVPAGLEAARFAALQAEPTAGPSPCPPDATLTLGIDEAGGDKNISICRGESVVVRAALAEGAFPEGQPLWSITSLPIGSHMDQFELDDGLTAVTFHPDVPGIYELTATCGPISDSVHITAVKITFDTTEIKTGFTRPVGKSLIKVAVVATVEPAVEADYIELVPAGPTPNRILIENIVRDGQAGTVRFDVKGRSPTPHTRPLGDTTIQAMIHGHPAACAEMPVVVLIPKTLTPLNKSGPVAGVNLASNANTSPAFPHPLAEDAVHLDTHYHHWLVIPVNDQFGNQLTSLYEGATVAEQGGVNINQKMRADGTYLDPVGSFTPRPEKSAFQDNEDNRQIIEDWLAEPPDPQLIQPITPINILQDIPVQVGGHLLEPGVVNRRVIATSPNQVEIIWTAP